MIGVGEDDNILLDVQRDGDLFLFDQMFEISQQLVDEGFEPHGFGDSWARVGIGEQVIDNRVEPADFLRHQLADLFPEARVVVFLRQHLDEGLDRGERRAQFVGDGSQ